MSRGFFITILLLCSIFTASARVAKESKEIKIAKEFTSEEEHFLPRFGLWRTSYFTTGVQTNKPLSVNSADVKFQVSVALRMWRIRDKAEIFFTYSQHSVWDIYRPSCPFRETAYNPGVWALWRLRSDMDLLFGLEHESNGLGATDSRSYNYISAAWLYTPAQNWRVGVRLWYGYFDIENIQRYHHFRGIGHAWATFHTLNERFQCTVLVNPTILFDGCNLHVEASWRLSKKKGVTPSLYAQYSYGYGDTMLDYNRKHSAIRVGIALKNDWLNFY